MRAQVRPRSSQVPRPMSGMRAPCASMNRADIFYLALGLISLPSVSIIPARRVRRVDDTHTSLFEAGGIGHFRIALRGVGKGPICGGMGGGGRERDMGSYLQCTYTPSNILPRTDLC